MDEQNVAFKLAVGSLADASNEIYRRASDVFLPEDGVLDMSANENPLGPSPLALAAVADVSGNFHCYPDSHGTALRVALANQLGVDVGQLILGNGSSELLDLIARATLAPGDQALIATPSFLPYRSAIQRARGVIVQVPLTSDYCFDLDRMAEQIGRRTRLVILGHPNNPTGTILGTEEFDRFLDRLPDQAVVLVDEAYHDYVRRPDAADAIALLKNGRPVVAVRTFSKLHALAGLRIGYAAAHPALAAQIESLRPHYNTSSAAQAAALACLADDDHIARSLSVNCTGLVALSSGCADLGLEYVPSEANFLLVRTGNADDITAAMKARCVLVKSGRPFGLPDHIRISVGTPASNARCLKALQCALNDYRINNPINKHSKE
ncbi:MAG: histidinol-phosphate transaminase [Georgfuchsia sp.]